MNDWEKKEIAFQDQFASQKIVYEPCLTLVVKVLCGRNISVGRIHDLVDVPDPKVILRCAAAQGRKVFETKVATNQVNPVWNEQFTFVFPQDTTDAVVEIRVYEVDSFWFDPQLGSKDVELRSLELEKLTKTTVKLKHGEVDLEFLKRKRDVPDYRLSLGLSDDERQYRINRKVKTMKALQEILDVEKAPTNLNETPTIALAISGGGYRAVANSCGIMEALAEHKLVDSLMYLAGLSGSSWYISSAYLHKAVGNRDLIERHHEWLKQRMKSSLTNYLFDLSFYKRYRAYRNWKIENHQKTTFVDFYGLCLGETFLGQEYVSSTLSSLKDYVDTSDVPYPIISCAHVRDHLPMSQYWDEVETTPHEVSIPGYAINVPSDKFNSRWCRGILQQNLPTPPMHFMMGASGSAFAILWTKIDDKSEVRDGLQEYINQSNAEGKDESNEQSLMAESDESDEDVSSETQSKSKTRNFADAEDHWINQIGVDSSKEQLATIGRSFLLERTSKALNIARHCDQLSKYTFNGNPVDITDHVAARFQRKVSGKAKNISLCDSALGCNLPVIHLLRPQRTVDILIIMDCGNYIQENCLSMEPFATVQSQIYDHGIKFPKISIEKVMEDPFREFYLFEDPDDPECPIVLWFTLANKSFKEANDVQNRHQYDDSEDNSAFNDFSIFPESSDFGTMRLSFSEKNFDRLRELAKFNVMSNINHIKEKIEKKIQHLKNAN